MLEISSDELESTPLRSALELGGREIKTKFEKARHHVKVRDLSLCVCVCVFVFVCVFLSSFVTLALHGSTPICMMQLFWTTVRDRRHRDPATETRKVVPKSTPFDTRRRVPRLSARMPPLSQPTYICFVRSVACACLFRSIFHGSYLRSTVARAGGRTSTTLRRTEWSHFLTPPADFPRVCS